MSMNNRKHILHYGLQRSGTNFLEGLLEENYRLLMLNSTADRRHPLVKHFRLYDEKKYISAPAYYNDQRFSSLDEFIAALQTEVVPDAIIIISKDPYSWLKSYKSWAEKCNWSKVEFSYVREYNLFYNKWRELASQSSKVVFVRYVDLICNTEDELLRLEKQFGLSRRMVRRLFGRKLHLQKVSQSASFTKNRRDYYLNREYLQTLADDEMDEINQTIDPDLLRFLGYEIQRKV